MSTSSSPVSTSDFLSKPWIGQVDELCNLISLLNAAIAHNLPAPRPETPGFEELRSVRIATAMEMLGLEAVAVDLHPDNLTDGLPVQLTLSTPDFGLHSVLVVGVEWVDVEHIISDPPYAHFTMPVESGCYLHIINLRKCELVSRVRFGDMGHMLPLGLRIGNHMAASIQLSEESRS